MTKMNRRAAIVAVTATTTVAGVSASNPAAAQMAKSVITRFDVADAVEAEAELTRMVEGPGMTVVVQSFSLTPNAAGRMDLIVLSLNPV